jgi:ABC-type nitrate/sulfonate/bicarbonate transport system permease component
MNVKPMWRTISRALARGWLAVLLLILWEVVARAAEEAYFPPPTAIVSAMGDLWFSGPAGHLFLTSKALDDFVPSLTHVFTGWLLASAAGIVLGVTLGRSRTASDYADPLLQLGRAMPPPTLIPFFIIVFHLGGTMQVATIAFGVVWPVLLNTVDGARTVDPLQLDTAEVFGITGWQRLWRVILPSAAPKIFAGLRVSLSFAVILMVVSELIGGTTGIGAELLTAQRTFELPAMWAGIVLLGALGYLFNGAFLLVEGRLLAWHTGARRLET